MFIEILRPFIYLPTAIAASHDRLFSTSFSIILISIAPYVTSSDISTKYIMPRTEPLNV